jgi:hydroxyacylglutathione hydrolase
MTDMIASLRRLLTELPDETYVYPGHNLPTTIRDEKEFNPYAPR